MWPGQQPPGGEQNPQDQNPNPYQQPGYQQPNPYQQPGYQQQPHSGAYSQPEQPQWAAPTPPPMPPQPGGGQGGDGNKTKITAIVAALAVVVAAGVTGFLVLGGDKDDEADGKPDKKTPAKSAAPKPSPTDDGGTERGTGKGPKPTIEGWQVVVNPKWGTAFDVPADWEVATPDTFIGFEDSEKGDGSALIGMSAPAHYKSKWCSSDDDKDGTKDDTALGAVGTKGQNGAKNTKDVARNDSAWWVFGGYTDQKKADKKKIKVGKVESYTTTSGIKGSVATSTTSGVTKNDKCDSDGKATTFSFKNSDGEYVAWSLYGAKGVKDEIPDATVKKILSTVRLQGDGEES
ncbi:hypothetical protein GCM10009837_60740 [Streptomyces durmitorensis]|uniref:DUF8017 domain-containing protein n=1 Tax=Streptomyces durmitorensis TaxID=319947 RepID=A0ABY4Q1K7_9ACTN|nr:hypothetical protein [Streptomyces durmitorensis]UQT59957.1 hypothetical protein M4V62_35605 [Streptomyces durmitorensis]